MERSERRHAAQRGFSFIEILIVMGIISVLVGGVIVAINLWAEKQPEFATETTLNKTKALIENWHTEFEVYPPSDVTKIANAVGMGDTAATPENTTNGPIEAVYQALFWPGFKSSTDFNSDELSNTDEDKLKKAIGKTSAELKEIRDGWGNPLVYFSRDDYGKPDHPMYLSSHENEVLDVQPQPYKNDDGTFVNAESFQIWSMGPDGEPNTDDDILPWKN